MSGILYHEPSEVIKQLLLDLLLGSPTEGTADWPIYVSHHPDSPDDSICVYDTEARLQGRLMTDGETVEHYGIQVRVRANEKEDGEEKIQEIVRAFDVSVVRTEVTLDEHIYLVQAINRIGRGLPIGFEIGSRRRLWTLNALVSMRYSGELGTGT